MTDKLTVRAWYDPEPSNPGWYAEVMTPEHPGMDEATDSYHVETDSLKHGFPVDLDHYEPEDVEGVRAALEAAYPAATVEVLETHPRYLR